MNKMNGSFTINTDANGAKITPTPKFPVEISCNIDIRAIEYDSLCAVDHAWDFRNGGIDSEAQEAIIKAACKAFKKNLKKTMNCYVYVMNSSHPIFAFGDMFLLAGKNDQVGESKYGVAMFLYGQYIGYCYVEHTELRFAIDVPRIFMREEGTRFNNVIAADAEYMQKATPLNMRPIDIKISNTRVCRKWVKAVARSIAEDIGYKCCGYEPEDYPYKKFMSEGFVYLITELCYSYIDTLPKANPTAMMQLIRSYEFIAHFDGCIAPLTDLVYDSGEKHRIIFYDSPSTDYNAYDSDDVFPIGGLNISVTAGCQNTRAGAWIYRTKDGINTRLIGGVILEKYVTEENVTSWQVSFQMGSSSHIHIGTIDNTGAYTSSSDAEFVNQTDIINDIISQTANFISSEYILEYSDVCSELQKNGSIREMIKACINATTKDSAPSLADGGPIES